MKQYQPQFKLKVGDTCRLVEKLPDCSRSNAWTAGVYRVKSIVPFYYAFDKTDPRVQSYRFEKIKLKDGSTYPNFSDGYNCIAWDQFITDGKVTII